MLAVKVILCLCCASFLEAAPEVHTPWGTVRGLSKVTEDWTSYDAFFGIPYALPPVGDRRFSRPQPHPGFSYTFNATSYGPMCIQNRGLAREYGVYGDEDCLTLNIFTPVARSDSSKFPVMVWIHGGGFVVGSAPRYDGSAIVARGNVVFVNFQYRLGAFGFLSTGDSVAKGNYGLWDQLLALQWIKKNIGSFGGDASKITIIGQSAGSVSVGFHALHSGSKGLFQRTIMQSGAVTTSFAYTRNGLSYTKKLAQRLNCLPSRASDHAALVQCLRKASAKSIADASFPITTDPIITVYDVGFVPTIDGEFIKDDPLVLINDENFLKTVGFDDLDCMVSVTSNEGGNILPTIRFLDTIYNTTLASSLLDIPNYRKILIRDGLKVYFGASSPDMVNAIVSVDVPAGSAGNTLDPQIIMDTVGDLTAVSTLEFARAHSKLVKSTNSGKKTYVYLFDTSPSFLYRKARGTIHGEDIYFTFGLTNATIVSLNQSIPTTAERQLANSVMDFITDFAKNGDPSPGVSTNLHADWPEFTEPEEKYLHLDTHMTIASHPFNSSITLWTQTLPKLFEDWKQKHPHTTTNPSLVLSVRLR